MEQQSNTHNPGYQSGPLPSRRQELLAAFEGVAYGENYEHYVEDYEWENCITIQISAYLIYLG